jgi:hypothetical protein
MQPRLFQPGNNRFALIVGGLKTLLAISVIFFHLLISSFPQQHLAYLESLTENLRFQSMKSHLIQSESHWLHKIKKPDRNSGWAFVFYQLGVENG